MESYVQKLVGSPSEELHVYARNKKMKASCALTSDPNKQFSNASTVKQFANTLQEGFSEIKRAWGDNPLPSFTVNVPGEALITPVLDLAEKAVVLFFPGHMPAAPNVGSWLKAMLQGNYVCGCYIVDRGFYEVIFSEPKYRQMLLEKSPLFFGGQLVHVYPWSPTKDYQSLIRHKCPVWVEVTDIPLYCEPALSYVAQNLGKVVCPPRASANAHRFCVLWDTDVRTPPSVTINVRMDGMVPQQAHFTLKWGRFAGSCFSCGKFGHMQSECPTMLFQAPTNVVPPSEMPIVANVSNVQPQKGMKPSKVQPVIAQDKGKAKVNNVSLVSKDKDKEAQELNTWQTPKKVIKPRPVVQRNWTENVSKNGSVIPSSAFFPDVVRGVAGVGKMWTAVLHGESLDMFDGFDANATYNEVQNDATAESSHPHQEGLADVQMDT